jgi:hypothetical protein
MIQFSVFAGKTGVLQENAVPSARRKRMTPWYEVPGLDCVPESLCGFWIVGRVHERLPTAMPEFFNRHAAVVQHALIDMC